MKTNILYRLFWLTSTTLLISNSNLISIATPLKIAQVNPLVSINRPTIQIGSQGELVKELQAALKILGFYDGEIDGNYQQNTAIAVSQFQQTAGLNSTGIVDNATWQKLFPNANNLSGNLSNSTTPQGNTSAPFTTVSTAMNPQSSNNKKPTKPNPKLPPGKNTNTKNTNPRIQPTPINQRVPGIQYTSEGWPILRLGMKGKEVVKLQQQLKILGFLTGKIDGDFGKTTENAVKEAQSRYGLNPDGVVGGSTWQTFIKRTAP